MHRGSLLVVALLLLSGCVFPGGAPVTVAGSGNPVTIQKDFTGFTKVAAGNAFQLTVTQERDYRVSVTLDENLEQYLSIEMQGDTLRISLQPGVVLRPRTGELQAEVAMPSLRGLDLSGASRATVTGFTSDMNLAVQASGASSLQGEITAGNVNMDVSGASRVTLEGAGGALDLDASGASFVNLADFPVTDANVNVNGASQADLNINGSLDGEVSGASRLYYRGDVTLGSMDTSGASTIERR